MMAGRLPVTGELRQRMPRHRDSRYLDWLRTLICATCQARHPEAAHVRMSVHGSRRRSVGMGEKPDDRDAVPLCARCHRESTDAQHRTGERPFWQRHRIDPLALSVALYKVFRNGADVATANRIIRATGSPVRCPEG